MLYAWLAVDKDGTEWIHHEQCNDKPRRGKGFAGEECWVSDAPCCQLPKGSIQKLIGRSLTWDDEPVELRDEE